MAWSPPFTTLTRRSVAHRPAGCPLQLGAWRRRVAPTGCLTAGALLAILPGCAARHSTIEIVDFRHPGLADRYREHFDEGYFDIDRDGNVDVVLRRRSPDREHPSQTITQIIHIRSLWRSIPGRTVAHSTQINGTIRYHVVAGRLGATFEGSGSIFFDLDRSGESLRGSLGLAVLNPKHRQVTDTELFTKARLQGDFRAVRAPRRVIHLINEMERFFASS